MLVVLVLEIKVSSIFFLGVAVIVSLYIRVVTKGGTLSTARRDVGARSR